MGIGISVWRLLGLSGNRTMHQLPYGTPEDFAYFVDYLHKKGIDVILDRFRHISKKAAHGLADFDGTPIYEYADPRMGEHPDWGTKVRLWKKQVKFPDRKCCFWIESTTILTDCACGRGSHALFGRTMEKMRRMDTDKYGENKNLEAIEFFSAISTHMILGRNPGTVMMQRIYSMAAGNRQGASTAD